MFFSFIQKSDIKENFIIRVKKEERKEQQKGKTLENKSCEISDIKDLMGTQFQSLVQEILLMHEKIDKTSNLYKVIGERVKKIEDLMESTIDEMIGHYLIIFQNMDNDLAAIKKNLIEDLGKKSALSMIKKMHIVLQDAACEDTIKEKVAQILKILEE